MCAFPYRYHGIYDISRKLDRICLPWEIDAEPEKNLPFPGSFILGNYNEFWSFTWNVSNTKPTYISWVGLILTKQIWGKLINLVNF